MWATADAAELKMVTDQIGNGVLVIEACDNRHFRILSINRRIEQIAGLKHAEISGRSLEQLLPAQLAERIISVYQRCIDEGQCQEFEESLDLPNGRMRWRTTLTPISDARGRITRLFASTIDLTAHQQLEDELRQTAKALQENGSRLHSAMRGAEIGIWDWDIPAGRIWIADHWAPALQTFKEPTSITVEEWTSLIHPDDRAPSIEAGKLALKSGTGGYSMEHRFRTAAGEWKWRHVYGAVTEYDDAGKPSHICGTHRDINQQKEDQKKLARLTAELEYRASHDSLTGALNRGAILDQLEREISRARREKTCAAVALIDADHFKEINDTHGHQVGDEALRELVLRVREVLRPYDHLGRYGGEEFLVVTNVSNGILNLHERIRDAVACAPFSTSAGLIQVTVSIGVATTGTSTTAHQLINQADQALYQAKHAGRNRVMESD